MDEEQTLEHLKWLRSPERAEQIATTERKRQELLKFIKIVGGSSIYVMYNHYLKEMGCEALIPDGHDKDV